MQEEAAASEPRAWPGTISLVRAFTQFDMGEAIECCCNSSLPSLLDRGGTDYVHIFDVILYKSNCVGTDLLL